MRVSGVAIGQWNQLCNKKEGVRRTTYKLNRAVVMGEVSHIYDSKDYIVRYHDLNILVSKSSGILTVWRYEVADQKIISDSKKMRYDLKNTHKKNLANANQRHKFIVGELCKNELEGNKKC